MKKHKIAILGCYIVLFVMTVVCLDVVCLHAQDDIEEKAIEGEKYEFDKDNDYDIASSLSVDKITNGTSYGIFSVEGDIKKTTDKNGFKAYDVSRDNVIFKYSINDTLKAAKSDEWHVEECKSKSVDKLKLDEKVKTGAIVIQTSLDGQKWIVDNCITDIATGAFEEEFYNTNNIQQVNGCYYRIMIVYQLEKQEEDTKIAFVKKHNYSHKRFAEVYQFYLENEGSSKASNNQQNKYSIGETIKVKKNSGYSENKKEEISIDDVHYGWNIGEFYLSGFTEKQGDNDNLVILKKYGDTVTLWFKLDQDINKLNGDDKLSICEDEDGYDQYFGTRKTNFKHGALFIKYTNCENEKKDPVIYTDYLAACATTGADTKVELFEEGDYEVALDYEIKEDGLTNAYSDYRIAFKFSIRNGNCMFFPFDVETGSELKDGALTENGFRLDTAKSRFLNMDVKHIEISKNYGEYREDVRSNAVASDGDSYIKEGKYIITATNEYSATPTEKTIYVGKSPIIKAVASSGYSLEKINEMLSAGYILEDDGALKRENDEVDVTTEKTKKESNSIEDSDERISTELTEDTVVSAESDAVIAEESIDDKNHYILYLVLLFCIVVSIVGIITVAVKRKVRRHR